MNKNINFTRGEWVAALTLLLMIVSGYLFYGLYDGKRTCRVDMSLYAAQLEDFNMRQAALRDSVEAARANRWREGPVNARDTNPRNRVQKKPMYEIVKLDINHCDTGDIVVVPLFGSKRAARLVEYRDRLGGFYSLSQVREVFVLQDMDMEHLQKYFTLHPEDVRKININNSTYKELVSHPYFDAYLAKTILNHRAKHGDIASFEELQQVTHAYPELMEKLKHYVVFQ
ncbi:MAG: helix-hairpin-helix domain-containing protein [Bacteroidales bacterium]|nr:helix-hairpin-helix domain-containing protein [Bacteroidales bacterium]